MILLLACAKDPVAESAFVELDAPRLLRRISLDLRGVLPSVAELDSVEANPAEITALRDQWLDDPELELRLVSLFGERWNTRIDMFDVRYYDYSLDREEEFEFERSVGEEPLRLAASIVAKDRPWTEIVTADYTMANEMLGRIWPIDYPEGGTGWTESVYTDSRPAAGVLTTNGLWWRYTTNRFNNNRTRAAALFRLLLCEDFLQRPVSFSASQALSGGVTSEEALKTNKYCITCHVSLDPVSALFFGFWWQAQYSAVEMSTYHAEREPLGQVFLDVESAWFGEPVYGLVDLGEHIAEDSRFHQCAAETMASMMWRREVDALDLDRLTTFREAYEADGYRIKSMLRAITDEEVYRAGSLSESASDEQEGRELPVRLLSVDQLASVAEDISGFKWTFDGFDQLGNDTYGYRVMGGGVNGENVTRPQQEPGVTWALVVERLAEATAFLAVTELADPDGRRLFRHASLDTRPGDAAFDAELADLHWRLLGVRADTTFLADATELWSGVLSDTNDPATAWSAVLTVLLRDPAFVTD